MKTSDPAAYDQFVDISTFTNSAAPFGAFRSLMLTHTAAATVTFNIQQSVGGVLGTAKSIVVRVPANGTFILPLSGETVYVSSLTATAIAYALI